MDQSFQLVDGHSLSIDLDVKVDPVSRDSPL